MHELEDSAFNKIFIATDVGTSCYLKVQSQILVEKWSASASR